MAEENNLKPDPEALLSEIEKDRSKKGSLKIFLGYAPGVGKTYSMLEQARAAGKRGIDAVIGLVETHKRKETEALLEGFEVVPLKHVTYGNVTLGELDTAGIIKRRPQLVIVDELAHTNAPGMTHLKRYQDVLDLVDAGIDVYTAVNIQHFESMNDIVMGVTGIKVRETVPDAVLDRAEEIEVVDIPVEELHLRLKEGKVYIPEQAKLAVDNFFKRSNLMALREVTLRRVATKLDAELVNYMKAKAIIGPWPVAERLMVCVAPSPYAKQMIRKAYYLANEIKAEWYAVYVESVSGLRLDDTQRAKLAAVLEFAEELGAKVRTISGNDVAEELLKFSAQEKVTRIMIGKPAKSGITGLFMPSPAERLMSKSKNIDLYLIEPTPDNGPEEGSVRGKSPGAGFSAVPYIYSLFTLIPVIAAGLALNRWLQIENTSIIFVISVFSTALLFGTGPSLFVSLVSIMAYDLLLVPPYYTFNIGKPEYIVEIVIFMIVSVVTGEIARVFRRQSEALRVRLENIRMLEQMGRELLAVPAIEQVMESAAGNDSREMVETIRLINTDILESVAEIISRYLARVIRAENLVLFRDKDGRIKIWSRSDGKAELKENDYAIAAWVYEKGSPAGLGTRTLTSSEYFFLPMTIKDRTTGVLAIKDDYAQLLPQDRYILSAISDFAAITAEKCAKVMEKG